MLATELLFIYTYRLADDRSSPACCRFRAAGLFLQLPDQPELTTGPGDGPGCGLGVGVGERLHYWVFGWPGSYDSPARDCSPALMTVRS